jgi:hypothetical protein
MLSTSDVITLFLFTGKPQKFLENSHINFYFLQNEHTERIGKIRAHAWCPVLCILRKRTVSPKVDILFQYVCRVDDHFSNITTPTGRSINFMVQVILWKLVRYSDFQRTARLLHGTRSFSTVLKKVRQCILSGASRILFAPSIPISLCTDGNTVVKCILKQMGCEAVELIQLAQDKIQ